MHTHTATVRWTRNDALFTDRRYSRAHSWTFDGGAAVPASSSPLVVRTPFSDPGGVDPEEAFVASLASCHMLFFLDFACQAGFVVDSYEDAAVGEMGRDEKGREMVAKVILRPRIVFSGAKRPDDARIEALHHRAHEECFIANSVKTVVTVARAD